MKEPKLGLMATSNRGNTPILNRLRKSFEPSKPLSLEERLAQLTEIEMQWLTSNASMLQSLIYLGTKVGDFSQDYLGLYNSMYPKDMDFKRQELLRDFLEEIAPLDWEKQPKQTKPSYKTTTFDDDWINPYDVDRIQREALAKYPPKTALEPEEQSDFLHKLIQSESSGRADAEITIKDGRRFVGKLQFGDARLQDFQNATGTTFTQDEFKADEALQDEVAEWHFAQISEAVDALGSDADGYDRDGLKAVAHLGGVGGMRKFVQTKGSYNPADELGTSLQSYYDKFANGGGA